MEKDAVKKRIVMIMMLAVILKVSGTAVADRRSYVWTYEYQTMPKGQSEIEYYLTHKVADFNRYHRKNVWDNQVEYEYGLTDRWDLAVYQRWEQTNTKSEDEFEYTGTKLRTRYRFSEKGVWPLDTLLYLEYIWPDYSGSPQKIEGKIILAKDFGKYNLAYNQIIVKGINNNGVTEHEYAIGLSYEFNPRLKIALESKGNFTEEKYYLGPTVSWATEKFWVNLGALRGLNDISDDFQIRLIVGIPF